MAQFVASYSTLLYCCSATKVNHDETLQRRSDFSQWAQPTDGDPNHQSCSDQTTRWSSTDPGGPVDQARDPLEDAAHSPQVVNTSKATACEGDVPRLVPVPHVLRGDWSSHVVSAGFWRVWLPSSVSLTASILSWLHSASSPTELQLLTLQHCTTFQKFQNSSIKQGSCMKWFQQEIWMLMKNNRQYIKDRTMEITYNGLAVEETNS